MVRGGEGASSKERGYTKVSTNTNLLQNLVKNGNEECVSNFQTASREYIHIYMQTLSTESVLIYEAIDYLPVC